MTDHARPAPIQRTVASSGGMSALNVLLGLFAACLAVATLIALGLGFDLLVPPPDIAESLDLPGRLQAIRPFREATWPFDAASTLLYVVGFGALALAAEPIASLAGSDGHAGVLRASILTSGALGVVAGLLYVGGTQVVMALPYCDCGFIAEETISQFWSLSIVQGATNWLGYGAILFGAIAAGLTATMAGYRGLPRAWRWIGGSAATLLVVSVVLHELSDSPAGDLSAAVASGILLPAWAIILAMRSDRIPADPSGAA